MENICIRMKELRKDFCLSQVEFAQRLGVTNAHISKIEKGKTVPSDSLVKLTCKEFGVNELWLKNGEKPVLIEEIELNTEKLLTYSTEKFNKLLKTDSVLIRSQAAQLDMLFSEITNIENLNYNDKLLYLKMLEKTLYDLNKVLCIFKQGIFDYQISIFNPDELIPVFNNGIKEVIDSLNQFIELYSKRKMEP